MIKKKGNKLHVKWKAMVIVLIVGLIKKTYYKMSYVPTYSEVEEEIVRVTLNLSNYVTQKEFKNVTRVDTSDFALEVNVAEIKEKLDSISVDKLDEREAKSYVDDVSYLYFENSVKYYTTHKASDNNTYLTSWQSRGRSSIKIISPISLAHEFSLKMFLASYNPIIVFNKSYLKTTFISNLNPSVSIYFIFRLLPDNLDATITLANSLYGMMSYTKKWKKKILMSIHILVMVLVLVQKSIHILMEKIVMT